MRSSYGRDQIIAIVLTALGFIAILAVAWMLWEAATLTA